jgi:hypothetical protein
MAGKEKEIKIVESAYVLKNGTSTGKKNLCREKTNPHAKRESVLFW